MPRIRVKVFSTLRDLLGEKEVHLEGDDVGEVLARLKETYGERLGDALFDESTGKPRENYVILLNGRHIRFLGGLETRLNENDVIAIFPPVGGGHTSRS